MALKADALAIQAALSARDLSHTGTRSWWGSFAFHVTDVRNAAGILTTDGIYCREEACNRELMKVDNADLNIIARSAARTNRFARLYFRPRNPFHWDTEGCRPIGKRHHSGAHTAVPIFFLFKLPELLSEEGTSWTDGTAASDSNQLYSDATSIPRMNWRDIYSLGGMGSDIARKGELKYHRMAEILVDGFCPLDHLAAIACRSAPDRHTLLSLLSPEDQAKWSKRIKINTVPDLFEGYWTYLRSVQWLGEMIRFSFNAETLTPGPFDIRIILTDMVTGKQLAPIEVRRTLGGATPTINVRAKDYAKLRVEIVLDGSLIYLHTITPTTMLTDAAP